MPVVELRNVEKNYQLGQTTVSALKGVNLSIEAGEFSAVSGPSGSGKTTMLNIIGCIDAPSAGEYLIDGDPVEVADFDDLAELRNEKLGFIFQQTFNLIPVLDVMENIEFPMLVRPDAFGPKKERREKIAALAAEVGLEPYMHHRPDELSGGQRQRVAVARALATNPRIILADEPTANLDGETAASLLDLMEKLNDEHGVTFVFSTHDERILRRARRIIRLVDGQIAQA